jgi:hypothetical protein
LRGNKNIENTARCQWFAFIILSAKEAGIKNIAGQGQLRPIVSDSLISMNRWAQWHILSYQTWLGD